MSNNIVEENPAQDSKAPSGPQGQGAGGGQDKVRKQARQLAYDVRYKVKQGFKDGQKTDPASLKQAFVSQLGRSPAPGPVKGLAKKMLVGETYDFVDVSDTVESSIANAIKSIFVENKKCCKECGSYDHVTADCPEKEVNEEIQEKKYKVRVTDKKTGKSYTRFADRAKISELRKNPNISSVEMTGYGTPYEGEKKKGESTAAVKSGKGLANKDYDGDGKKETPTAEYKGSKDKAIKKALAKEEFIGEVNAENENPSANPKKIDVMKGKNKVVINPNMGEQNELAPKADDVDSKQKRVAIMKKAILQKKMQAVRGGAGADIVAHNELEGEVISEKEVKVKDTKKVIDAIRAYDKSKDASRDATADSDEGKTGKAKKEKAYAKKERGEIDKDDPNWKKKKYHTGMHGEEFEVDEGVLVNVAKEAEKVGGAAKKKIKSGAKKVVKGAAKLAYKGVKKVASATARGAAGVVGGAVKGAVAGGYKGIKKGLSEEDLPLKDQDDQQIANVTFDGGGPDGGATIKGSGDSREIPTFVALIKNKLRARGILVSHHEPKGNMIEGYDNTKAPDYDKKKKALAKKHGGADKVKGHPQYESTVQSAVDSLNAIAKKEGKVIEGYQRDPEKGEEEARKADTRSAKQKRMADPKKGINSPAFRKFMADRGM